MQNLPIWKEEEDLGWMALNTNLPTPERDATPGRPPAALKLRSRNVSVKTNFIALLYHLVMCSCDVQGLKCSVQALSTESLLYGAQVENTAGGERMMGRHRNGLPCQRAGRRGREGATDAGPLTKMQQGFDGWSVD